MGLKSIGARAWAVGFGLASMQICAIPAASTSELPAAAPRTYALVAAVGERFTLVSQGMTTGSHLSAFTSNSVRTSNDLLNRLALQSLQRAVAKTDAAASYVLLELAEPELDALPPYEREDATIAAVIAELKAMPQRSSWYRIVVVTPAYHAQDIDGMASRLVGFGIYTQPLGGGTMSLGGVEVDLSLQGGEKVTTPTGPGARSQTFIAPFSYVEVWVVDPQTLQVLDKQKQFANQKLFDPHAPTRNLYRSLSPQFVAEHVGQVISSAVGDAVAHTELALKRGQVTTGPTVPVDDAASAPPR